MKKSTAKSLHPESSDLNHEAYKRGCALFKDGNFHKAKLEFEEALEFWPEDSQAWMALGNCEDELNKPTAAEISFRRALLYCEEKNRSAIQFNLANSLLDQERHGEAIELYEQIPGNSDVYAAAQTNLSIARRSIDN
jgi:tetratricopeptide (TPR) repeat protein